MTYNTVDEWLNEIENYSLRSERIPADAIPWVKQAWRLGKIAGMSQVLEVVRPQLDAIAESNERVIEILNRKI
jgi:hypothetical protein